jgi:cytochrome c oxidase subunit 2
VILGNGERITADEEYIRESILNPGAKIVDGYMPVMPNYENQITDQGVNLLVDYLKSLE